MMGSNEPREATFGNGWGCGDARTVPCVLRLRDHRRGDRRRARLRDPDGNGGPDRAGGNKPLVRVRRDPGYGSTTEAQTEDVTNWTPVEASVEGLDPATTYHFRLCVDDDQGHGICGEDQTFTTTDADTVSGNANHNPPGNPGQVFGIVIDARSDPDGSNPGGTASIYVSDSIGFRNGDVSCLRVDGSSAAIGYDSRGASIGDAVIFVRSDLPTRFDVVSVAEAPTTCPDPASSAYGLDGNGTFTVVDVP